MNKKLIISILLAICVFFIWFFKVENDYKEKELEEAAFRTFFEQVKKDSEITEGYRHGKQSKEVFELSKENVITTFELLTMNYRALKMDDTDRYHDILQLFPQYWQLTSHKDVTNAQRQNINYILSEFERINKEVKLEATNKKIFYYKIK
ncbi:hypothetical protein ACQCVO_16175 [Bacillus infantis]|uniref:hypothetical protein n=1 Tax=Bacillus infantis TaxID=324767 RepID=UPI003CF74526